MLQDAQRVLQLLAGNEAPREFFGQRRLFHPSSQSLSRGKKKEEVPQDHCRASGGVERGSRTGVSIVKGWGVSCIPMPNSRIRRSDGLSLVSHEPAERL